MNLKRIGFSVAILIFGIVAGVIMQGAFGTDQMENSIEMGSAQQNSPDPLANEAAVPVESGHTVDRLPDLLVQSNSTNEEEQRVEDRSPDSESGRSVNLEQTFIRGDSLDATLTGGLESDEEFDRLMSQLRQDTSPIAAEKRMEYELKLYSQPLARDGSVSLDRFECGERLCAVELRAPDLANLGEFVRTLINSKDFEPRAVVALMAKPNPAAPYTQVTRVIFSHDLTVDSISVPRTALRSED